MSGSFLDRQRVIAEVLAGGEWLTADDVRNQWPEGTVPKPAKRTVQLDLNNGLDAGQSAKQSGAQPIRKADTSYNTTPAIQSEPQLLNICGQPCD